jgi:uncharacterized protein YccT (UPF0319 family)
VLKVNGEKQKFKLFQKERVIPLVKGPQQIILQYEDFYDVGFDDHEKVKSKPFMITFNHEEGHLKADFIRPEFLKIAQLFAENPDLKLVDVKTGKRISMDLESMTREQVKEHGANRIPMEDAVITSTPAKKEVKSSDQKKKKMSPSIMAPETSNESVQTQVEFSKRTSGKSPSEVSKAPLDHLRAWWKRASIEERQVFMREILK